jgi:TM2 domain-containing membrane protein YozV
MFNIIGADGKTYGPISAEQLCQWVREGRVNGHTQVQAVGSAEWKAATTVPELTGAFGATPPGAPPPLNPPVSAAVADRARNKVAAGICGIILGTWGVHKFILGYNNAGFVMLGISLGLLFLGILSCGITLPLLAAMHIIGFIEGILYLTKSDEEFVRVYVDGRKEWF